MVDPKGTVAAEWTLAGTSFIILVLRFYVRRYIARVGIQREDILLLVAQCFFFIWISLDAYTMSKGFMDGNRSYFDNFVKDIKLNDSDKVKLLKVVYASSIPYYLCIWVIKFAIIGLYYRIIPRTNTKTRYFLYFTSIFTLLTGICVLFINAFLCQPISQNWSLDWQHACYSSTAITPFVISVIFNLITDILIIIAPFPVLRTLNSLNKRQKAGLVVTFSLGFITVIVCVVRGVLLGSSAIISQTAVLTAVECFTAMIVAALPAMRILLRTNPFKRKLSSSQQKNSELSDDMNQNFGTTTDTSSVIPSENNVPQQYQHHQKLDSDNSNNIIPSSPTTSPGFNSNGIGDIEESSSGGPVSPGSVPPNAFDKRNSPLPPIPDNSNYAHAVEMQHFQNAPPPPLPGTYLSSSNFGNHLSQQHIPNDPLPGLPQQQSPLPQQQQQEQNTNAYNQYYAHHEEQRDPFVPDYLHRQINPTI